MIFSGSFALKHIELVPRIVCFTFLVSLPFLSLMMLVLVAACVVPLNLELPDITLIEYHVEVEK